MQIQKISVTGLFGIFDHVIPLNTEEGITIIHGPNGFGKTTILKLMYDLFSHQNDTLHKIPFHDFRVDFSGGSFLGVRQSVSCFQEIDIPTTSTQQTVEISPLPNQSTSLPATNVHLVESQRLLEIKGDNRRNTSTSYKVNNYSKALASHIRDYSAEYGKVCQSLDRTFPIRAFGKSNTSNITENELKRRISELEETRSNLIAIGLLEEDTDSNFDIQSFTQYFENNSNQNNDDTTKRILSIYVEDTEKKLNAFYPIWKRLDVLKRIINRKFSYSGKEINFSKTKGFIVKTKFRDLDPVWGSLKPINLSSGEQHELVLLYELLFKVKPGSFVLIDEPELSLHVAWQVDFLKDLQEIIKLTNIQILIATHSPDIIQDRWDLTVELKGSQV